MQAFNPYLTPQQLADKATVLQQQIGYLQNQLQGVQSSMQQPIQQMQNVQQQIASTAPAPTYSGVITRIVDNFESISANDVPMDNNGAFFVKNDGSEVQLRNWTAQGTIQTVRYSPVINTQTNSTNEATDSSPTSQKMEIGLSDEAAQAFMQRFDDLANRIDAMGQILSKPAQTKTTSARAKKEAES